MITFATILLCAPLIYAFTVPSAPDLPIGWFEPIPENVELEWDANDPGENVDYYQVERADESEYNWSTIASKVIGYGDPVEYTDWNPDLEVEYHMYRMRAHNSSGFSGYSQHETVWIYPEKK